MTEENDKHMHFGYFTIAQEIGTLHILISEQYSVTEPNNVKLIGLFYTEYTKTEGL